MVVQNQDVNYNTREDASLYFGSIGFSHDFRSAFFFGSAVFLFFGGWARVADGDGFRHRSMCSFNTRFEVPAGRSSAHMGHVGPSSVRSIGLLRN